MKIKINSRICVRCGGSKYIFDNIGHMKRCPNCSGEGIEYIISPKQLALYKEVWDLSGRGKITAARKNVASGATV